MTGILLAGGKSSRMGTDKAFTLFRGKILYSYTLNLLHQYCEDIIISTANTEFTKAGYRIINDKYYAIGPLGGIYSCISASSSDSFLILGCDMPLIPQAFIDLIMAKSKGFDITIGMNSEGKPEPLAGIYRSSILPVVEKQIRNRNYKMKSLINTVNSKIVNLDQTSMNPGKIFYNVNSPGDLLDHEQNTDK